MRIVNCAMEIANNLMERQPLSASLFPCCAYYGSVNDYVAAQVPPHWHPQLEVLVLDRGTLEVSLADTAFGMRQGDGYFVNANRLHSLRAPRDADCQYRSIVFDPGIVAGATGSPFDLQYVRPLLEHGPPALLLRREEDWQAALYDAFEQSYAACAAEPHGYEFTVRHALSQMVLCLSRAIPHQSPSPQAASEREKRLKAMIEWIDGHYAEPVQLGLLAAAVSLSPRECERTFQQLLQMTPMTYLMRRRVAAASELLVNTDLPIVEVGMQSGFSSHSYFAKQFRALTGYTPRDFRSLRSDEPPLSVKKQAT